MTTMRTIGSPLGITSIWASQPTWVSSKHVARRATVAHQKSGSMVEWAWRSAPARGDGRMSLERRPLDAYKVTKLLELLLPYPRHAHKVLNRGERTICLPIVYDSLRRRLAYTRKPVQVFNRSGIDVDERSSRCGRTRCGSGRLRRFAHLGNVDLLPVLKNEALFMPLTSASAASPPHASIAS